VCLVDVLVRKTLKQAKRLLKSGHCRLGRVRAAYSGKVRKGRVVKQRPAPYSELPLNSRVTVTISRGPKR
jgi:beta-lactam-binding protein with PASTA domain